MIIIKQNLYWKFGIGVWWPRPLSCTTKQRNLQPTGWLSSGAGRLSVRRSCTTYTVRCAHIRMSSRSSRWNPKSSKAFRVASSSSLRLSSPVIHLIWPNFCAPSPKAVNSFRGVAVRWHNCHSRCQIDSGKFTRPAGYETHFLFASQRRRLASSNLFSFPQLITLDQFTLGHKYSLLNNNLLRLAMFAFRSFGWPLLLPSRWKNPKGFG